MAAFLRLSRRNTAPATAAQWRHLLFLACALVVLPVHAQQPGTPDASPDPAIELLMKMQEAARKLDYSGVYTHHHNGLLMSSRVIHVVDGTGERERLEILDGMPREYVRHNDTSQCLVPDKKQVIIERRRSDRFPSLLMGPVKAIPSHYTVHLDITRNRIAGRECSVTDLIPNDNHRFGYRLCTDVQNNLLLKVQTLAPDNTVLEQIVFNSLDLGDAVKPGQLKPSWDTKSWHVVESSMENIDLAKQGWRIPFPPGFVPVTQVVRPMGNNRPVSQLVLADGLAAISIFIEPYRGTNGKSYEASQATAGAMNIFRTRIGDYWMTALGEVPALTVRSIAEHTEYVPAGNAD